MGSGLGQQLEPDFPELPAAMGLSVVGPNKRSDQTEGTPPFSSMDEAAAVFSSASVKFMFGNTTSHTASVEERGGSTQTHRYRMAGGGESQSESDEGGEGGGEGEGEGEGEGRVVTGAWAVTDVGMRIVQHLRPGSPAAADASPLKSALLGRIPGILYSIADLAKQAGTIFEGLPGDTNRRRATALHDGEGSEEPFCGRNFFEAGRTHTGKGRAFADKWGQPCLKDMTETGLQVDACISLAEIAEGGPLPSSEKLVTLLTCLWNATKRAPRRLSKANKQEDGHTTYIAHTVLEHDANLLAAAGVLVPPLGALFGINVEIGPGHGKRKDVSAAAGYLADKMHPKRKSRKR